MLYSIFILCGELCTSLLDIAPYILQCIVKDDLVKCTVYCIYIQQKKLPQTILDIILGIIISVDPRKIRTFSVAQ